MIVNVQNVACARRRLVVKTNAGQKHLAIPLTFALSVISVKTKNGAQRLATRTVTVTPREAFALSVIGVKRRLNVKVDVRAGLIASQVHFVKPVTFV